MEVPRDNGKDRGQHECSVMVSSICGMRAEGRGIQRDFLAWHLHPRGVTADPAFAPLSPRPLSHLS